MTPEEQELRYAIAGRPTEGPWQVRIGHDNHGLTGYQVLTHTHAAVCVAAQDYYAEGHLPNTDEDGYHIPDETIDCFPHRVATARYIAAANPQTIKSLIDDLDRTRAEAAAWENCARSLGWSGSKT